MVDTHLWGPMRALILSVALCAAAACSGQSSVHPEPRPDAGASGSAGSAASPTGGSAGRGSGAAGRGGVAGGRSAGGRCGGGCGRPGVGAGGAPGGEAGAGGELGGAAAEAPGGGPSGGDGHGDAGGEAGLAGAPSEPNPDKLPNGVCPEPTEWSAGVVSCDGSFIHRTEALGCALPEHDPDDLPPDAGEGPTDVPPECNQDADCAGGGYCVYDYYKDTARHLCVMPCVSDGDCGVEQACLCDVYTHNVSQTSIQLGRCMPASCWRDADCEPGSFCRSPLQEQECSFDIRTPRGLSCQTAADQCSGPGECKGLEEGDYAVCKQRADALVCVGYDEC